MTEILRLSVAHSGFAEKGMLIWCDENSGKKIRGSSHFSRLKTIEPGLLRGAGLFQQNEKWKLKAMHHADIAKTILG